MQPDIRQVQTWLAGAGFDPGPVDGIRGPRTDAAIVAFKRGRGLRPRPYLGPITLGALHAAWRRARTPADAQGLPWIEIAESVLGLHERRDNAALRAFLASDGATLGDPAELPWCGDFIETCLRLALPDEPFPGALGQNPYWARNWIFLGRPTAPTLGAVGVVPRGKGGHVFFLVGQDAGHWYALGGNQSNGVSRARIAKSRGLLGCRWPATYPARPISLPELTPGDMAVSTNEV